MAKLNLLITLIAMVIPLSSLPAPAWAQEVENQRINELESRVDTLSHNLADHSDGGFALFLCGAFCALWAQQTGRSAWLWFFAGMFFNIITLMVLLYKNSHDRYPDY